MSGRTHNALSRVSWIADGTPRASATPGTHREEMAYLDPSQSSRLRGRGLSHRLSCGNGRASPTLRDYPSSNTAPILVPTTCQEVFAYAVRQGSFDANNSTITRTPGPYSNILELPETPIIPAAPSDLEARVDPLTQKVNLRWVQHSGNEVGFQIERAPGSNPAESAWTPLSGDVNADILNKTDESAEGLTVYSYRIRAKGQHEGISAASNIVTVQTGGLDLVIGSMVEERIAYPNEDHTGAKLNTKSSGSSTPTPYLPLNMLAPGWKPGGTLTLSGGSSSINVWSSVTANRPSSALVLSASQSSASWVLTAQGLPGPLYVEGVDGAAVSTQSLSLQYTPPAGGGVAASDLANVKLTAEMSAMSVADAAYSANVVTDDVAWSDAPLPMLYVEEGANHTASVNITAAGSNGASSSSMLWRIDESNASPTSGTFASNTTLTVINNNRVWNVKGGFDANGNGTLETAEVSRAVGVTLVKVERLTVVDVANGYSMTNPTGVDFYVVESTGGTPNAGTAKIRIESDYLPTGPAAGQHILWDVLGGSISGATPGNFGAGAPVVTLAPGTGSRVYDVKIGFDNNADGLLQVAEIDYMIKVYVIKADVKSVTFAATNPSQFFPITADNASNAYSGPQWQDNSTTPDRDADDAGDIKHPLAYRRGATMKIDVSFTLGTAAGMTPDSNWIVKGDGPEGYDFYRRWGVDDPNDGIDSLSLTGNTLYMSNEAGTPFPNWIDHFDTFDIVWTVSFNGGVTWLNVGTTKNQVYTLLDTPRSTLFHTVAHIATAGPVKGLSDPGAVVDAIWLEFADNKVNRVQGALPVTELKYMHDAQSGFDTKALLTAGKGRCGAWARFFADTVSAHGIAASVTTINPNPAPAAPAGYSYANEAGIRVKLVPAQGSGPNNYPNVDFLDHAVVKVAIRPTTIFDPSYGKKHTGATIGAAELAWENASLIGTTYLYTDGVNFFEALVPNSLTSMETDFVP